MVNINELFERPPCPSFVPRPHYKIIILIIASHTGEHYDVFTEIWSKYMNSNKYIKSFFVYSNPDQIENVIVTENTITHRSKEWYEPGILYKTIAAMDYCVSHYSFDYLLRTNLSSFYCFPRLLDYIEIQPRVNYAAAKQNIFREGVGFLSGAGFILSKDIVTRFLNEVFYKDALTEENIYFPDDVTISMIVTCVVSVGFHDLPRYDCEDSINLDEIGDSFFHIRNKTEWKYGNRSIDIENIKKLYDFFYGRCGSKVSAFTPLDN